MSIQTSGFVVLKGGPFDGRVFDVKNYWPLDRLSDLIGMTQAFEVVRSKDIVVYRFDGVALVFSETIRPKTKHRP